MFISEEKILSDYHLDPFKVVGTEGMWGLCIFITLLPIMQLIKCGGYNATGFGLLCNYNYLENSAFAFHQMANNKWLIVMSSVTICDIAFFNYFGISITKYASAAQRSTVDLLRILFVWVFSVVLGLEKFNPYLLPGFISLSAGFLIYNEILVLPYYNLDYWTKDSIAKREDKSFSKYVAPSDSLLKIATPTRLDDTKKID